MIVSKGATTPTGFAALTSVIRRGASARSTSRSVRRRLPGTTVGMGNLASAPTVAWQSSLWANQRTGVDVSYCGLERMQLDADSWVDHCPGWMSGSDQAFEELLHDVAWSQRRRFMYDRQVDEPRLTSWQKSDQDSAVTHGWKTLVGHCRLATASGSTPWASISTAMAPTASPGTATAYRPRSWIPLSPWSPSASHASSFSARWEGGGRVAFKLGHGDLLVTGGQTQRRFEHSVPKVKAAGARMSVVFRHGVG